MNNCLEPIILTIKHDENSIVAECFNNVSKYIEVNGGEIQYGWSIWETFPDVMIEAEFHAVWKDNYGRLYDITPKKDGKSEMLFLPDTVKTYDGRQVNNVRVPLVENNIVKLFIEYCDKWFDILNEGENAYNNGLTNLQNTPKLQGIIRCRNHFYYRIIEEYYN